MPKLADPCTKSTAHHLIVYPAMERNEASNSIFYRDCMRSCVLPVGGGRENYCPLRDFFEGEAFSLLKRFRN